MHTACQRCPEQQLPAGGGASPHTQSHLSVPACRRQGSGKSPNGKPPSKPPAAPSQQLQHNHSKVRTGPALVALRQGLTCSLAAASHFYLPTLLLAN
jgi:hypothetical protein